MRTHLEAIFSFSIGFNCSIVDCQPKRLNRHQNENQFNYSHSHISIVRTTEYTIHSEWNLSIYKRDFVVAWFYQTIQSLVSCTRVPHFESLIAYGSGLIRIIVKTISMNSNNWRANNSKYIWYILMYLPGVCVCESSDRCKSCNERVIKIIIRVFFCSESMVFFSGYGRWRASFTRTYLNTIWNVFFFVYCGAGEHNSNVLA